MNAKELILAKINAGTNLARCYLHLIMMGFNMNDIVKFMTCPAVSLVNDLSTSNMFDEYMFDVKTKEAINMLQGRFPLFKFFNGSMLVNGEKQTILQLAFQEVSKRLQEKLLSLGLTMKDKNGKDVPKVYKSMSSIILDYYFERLNGSINESLISFARHANLNTRIINNLTAFSDYIDNVVERVLSSGDNLSDFMEDVDEFSKVYELATETSTLGSTFLGLNQGIPTSKEEIIDKLFKINKAMRDREKIFEISDATVLNNAEKLTDLATRIKVANPLLEMEHIVVTLLKSAEIMGNFDFIKWLNNENGYRKLTSDYYNLIKGTWNIFDIIDRLPHFDAIFETFKTILVTDKALIRKSYFLDKMCKDLFGDNSYIDKGDIKTLISYLDDLFVLKWINDKKFKFPVFKGDSVFDFTWKANKSLDNDFMPIVDESSRGTLKKLFEERLFTHLQEGYYYDLDEEGNQVRIEVDPNNKFIKTLIFDINRDGLPYLKLDLDMLNTSATVTNESRYQECLSDFIKLKNKMLAGRPLTDWFMIYNLLINKNLFGSDRLTTLFGSFINIIQEPSIIKDILTDLGTLDFSLDSTVESIEDLKELGYNRDDALYRIAPTISKSLEVNSSAILIKQKTKDGRTVVKRKRGRSYGDGEEIIPNSTDLIYDLRELEIDKINRIKNYSKYGVLRTPFANKLSSNLTNLKSDKVELILSALQNYVKLGIIEIYTENC